MSEQPIAHEQQESPESPREQAYQTLLSIQALQIEELQSNPEKSILEIQAIYEAVIKKEAEKNPVIWELYQQQKQGRTRTPEIKNVLEEDKLTQETVQKIWDTYAHELTPEEQEKLKTKIADKLGFIL